MPLILSVVRGPEGVAPERRQVIQRSFSIGRDPDSDWALADPDRVVSKRHCEISAEDGAWSITDLSSNGTLLNGASLDLHQPLPLRDRDRLTIGAYEFELWIDGPAHVAAPAAHDGEDEPSRLTRDPFTHGGENQGDDPLEAARPGVSLPVDFEPLGGADPFTEDEYVQPDHVPDLQQSFRPPLTTRDILPDDWDTDDEPSARPLDPAPVAQPISEPEPPAAAPAMGEDASPLAAFAAGAGLRHPMTGYADARLRELGSAFRAVVAGLRRMMIARSAIKGEFRINQTMIRAKGNNPLKFSADDDDALGWLLGAGREAGMPPSQAIEEAFRDMRIHELAVATAMQQAVRDLLAALSPARVTEQQPVTAIGKVLGLRKRAAWDRYCRLHDRTMRTLDNDFDSAFGRSFGRAYEAALDKLSARDADEGGSDNAA